jgi:transcriptional regulator with XRE-family HTH domain
VRTLSVVPRPRTRNTGEGPPKTLGEAFGRVLRRHREGVGYTQVQLAYAASLDSTYISLLEIGQRAPKLESIVSLARAVGITPAQLVAELSDEDLRTVPAAAETGGRSHARLGP